MTLNINDEVMIHLFNKDKGINGVFCKCRILKIKDPTTQEKPRKYLVETLDGRKVASAVEMTEKDHYLSYVRLKSDKVVILKIKSPIPGTVNGLFSRDEAIAALSF